MRNPTSRLSLLLLAIMTITAAGMAAAEPLPQTLERVDPKAPCFRWPAVDYDDDGVYDRIDYCPNTPKGCAVDQWGCSSDADDDGVCDQLDQCPGTPKKEKVDTHGCSASQAAGRTPAATSMSKAEPVTPPPPAPKPAPKKEVERKLVEGGTVRLENIEFESNSAQLLPESKQSLDEAGEALSKYPDLRIEVGGHSDTRGASKPNQRLSQARAESVRTYLLEHFPKLKPGNLTAKGYGESQPLTREKNDTQRKDNRRVELKVLNPEALPKNVKIVD